MHKRLSIRLVDTLASDVNAIAKKRGLSVNSLISEMAWGFVEEWKEKYEDIQRAKEQHDLEPPTS